MKTLNKCRIHDIDCTYALGELVPMACIADEDKCAEVRRLAGHSCQCPELRAKIAKLEHERDILAVAIVEDFTEGWVVNQLGESRWYDILRSAKRNKDF